MTIERLLAFGDAWNRGDVDDIMSYFAAECTYHASVGPEPGRTYRGREAVRRGVIDMLAYDRGGRSKTGPAFVAAERGVAEWSYEFTAADGAVTVIRGCDVFEFEGDLIRRKDAFRKVYD
ncbi:MAG: nuclear transport factor 2 family protein [Candidatus Eiseniibacteriota bacterium]